MLTRDPWSLVPATRRRCAVVMAATRYQWALTEPIQLMSRGPSPGMTLEQRKRAAVLENLRVCVGQPSPALCRLRLLRPRRCRPLPLTNCNATETLRYSEIPVVPWPRHGRTTLAAPCHTMLSSIQPCNACAWYQTHVASFSSLRAALTNSEQNCIVFTANIVATGNISNYLQYGKRIVGEGYELSAADNGYMIYFHDKLAWLAIDDLTIKNVRLTRRRAGLLPIHRAAAPASFESTAPTCRQSPSTPHHTAPWPFSICPCIFRCS